MTKNFTLCCLLVLVSSIGWSQTTFSTSGTYTVPANVFSLVVECWGAGGSGGGVTGKASSSGGGSGGSYVRGIVWVTPGATYTVTVGTPGTISIGNGGNGSASWFNSTTTILAAGGNGASGTAVINTAGSGAIAPGTGNVGGNIVSFYGGNGANAPSNLVSGGGGGSAGTSSSGNAGNGINGGSAVAGGGSGANGSTSNSVGTPGFIPGGGGSGAANPTGGDNKAGGAGARGQVVIANCTNYVLSSTTVSSPICDNNTATVTLTSTASSLPVGTYIVTYNVGAPNAATGLTATMNVTTAGSGTFTTAALANGGTSAITITSLATPSSGCNNGVTANNTASVLVNATTAISAQPAPAAQTICRNAAPTTLSVGATGANLTYQWYRNSTNSNSGGSLISGATANAFTPVTTVAGTTFYYVVVSGSCGTVTSGTASVVVNATTAISAQPAPVTQTICQNSAVTTLSVSAGGTNISYQWYSNATNSASGGTLISGATGSTYSAPTNVAGTLYYYAIVTGTCGTVTSNTATVVVNATTVITAQPAPGTQTVCQNAAPAALTVGATGTGLTYQWYRNTTNSTSGGTLISGATTASYTPVTTAAGTLFYYVMVTGSCGTLTSTTSAVNVSETTAITTQPSASGQMLCQNSTATALSVTASGTSLSYQWYSNTTNSNSGGTLISGATAVAYTPPTTTVGTAYFYVVVTGNCAPTTVTSAVSGAITVTPSTVISTQPSSGTFCQNVVAPALTVSATGTGTLSYQWYRNTTNSNTGGTAVGTNSSAYTPPTSAAGTLYYYVTVTGNCGVVTSNTATIVVNAATVITAQPAPVTQTVCQNVTATALSVSAAGTGTLTYQWYRNTSNSSSGGTLLSSATASTYTPITSAAGTLYYYVIVTGSCGTVTSNTATVVVNATTVINAQPTPASQTVCQNGAATALTVIATGTNVTYQWFSNITNSASGGTLISGATSGSYMPPTTAAGTVYYYVTVSGSCGTVVSSTTTVVTNATTVITAQPSPVTQTVCQNTAATTLTVSSSGTNLTYQWYSNTTNSSSGGTLLSGATASTYLPATTASGTLYYYVIVTGTCGTVTSNTTTVMVNSATVITVQPAPATQTVCQNSAATALSVSATGTSVTYQWYRNTTNSTSGGTLLSGATTASYTPVTTSTGTLYYYVIVNGTCGAATSGTAAVVVNATTVITAQPSPTTQSLCLNASAGISVAANGANLSYQWYRNTTNNNTGGTLVNGATATSFTPQTNVTGTLYYYVVVNGTCGVVTSNTATITVNETTVITRQPSAVAQEVCQNAPATSLSITATGTGSLTYQWFSNAVNSNSGGAPISGANSAFYAPTTVSAGTTYYYVTATGSCGSATSNTATVTVYPKSVNPDSATASANVICYGSSTVLALNGGGGGVNAVIKWYTGSCGGNLAGTGNNLVVSPTATTVYYGRYEDGTPCTTVSSCASVTVTVNALPAVASISGPRYVAEGRTIQLQNSTTGGTWSIDGTAYATISSTTANPVAVRGVSAAGTPVISYTITDAATQCTNTASATIHVYNPSLAHYLTNQDGVYSNAAIWNINRADGNGEVLASAVPGNDDNITVRHNLLLDQQYNGNAGAAFEITGHIQNGNQVPGTLTILPLQSFSSAGGVNFGGNPVVVKSDATGTGAIGVIGNSGIANATNVTVERYFGSADHPGGRRSWRLLTAPVTGVTVNNSWQEGLVRDTNRPIVGNLQYGTLITGRSQRTSANAFANGYDFWDVIANKSTSILHYKPGQTNGTWDTLPGSGLKDLGIDAYPAYMLFVRGNRSVLDTGYSTTTLRATGTLNQGTKVISVPGANVHAFTLVGNPYASPIDFEKLYQNSGTTGILHQFNIWNSNLGTYGAYQLINGSGGAYTVVPFPYTDTVQQSNDARFIPAGAGFFLQPADSVDATVVIDETAKAATQTAVVNPFRGTRPKDKQLFINLNLKNSDAASKLADGVMIGFNDLYSSGIDGSDVRKQTNFYENLGIVSGGVNLIMEAKPASFQTDTTLLRLWNTTRRAYQLQVKSAGFDTSGVMYGWIEDRYLNTKHNILLNGSITTIDFSVTTEAASARQDRFFVVLRNNAVVLPVTIIAVQATAQNGGVNVNWTVANEKNVVHYTVERSSDGGKTFGPVAKVAVGNRAGAGSVAYSSVDAQPVQGNNLYRIRWEDKEGKTAYSEVVLITIHSGTEVAQVTVYPNPVLEGQLYLQFSHFAEGNYRLELFTINGQKVHQAQMMMPPATVRYQQTVQIDKTLAAGSYGLRIIDGKGSIVAGTNIIIAK